MPFLSIFFLSAFLLYVISKDASPNSRLLIPNLSSKKSVLRARAAPLSSLNSTNTYGFLPGFNFITTSFTCPNPENMSLILFSDGTLELID